MSGSIAIINGGPYDAGELVELFGEITVDDLRGAWVACIVDAAGEGLLKGHGDFARVLGPVSTRLYKAKYDDTITAALSRRATEIIMNQERRPTTDQPKAKPMAAQAPTGITILDGEPPAPARRSRNTPDLLGDAMRRLEPGQFFSLDASKFKKQSVASKANAVKKADGIAVSVYMSIDGSIVVHRRKDGA